jgi:putative endonuclease
MENYNQRLQEHNAGLSNYTSKKIPWDLVYVEECTSRPEVLKREKNLKKVSKDRIDLALLVEYPY